MDLAFEFSTLDFHPQVNFKPRHCLLMTTTVNSTNRELFARTLYWELGNWLIANVGNQNEDWQITSSGTLASEKYRFWFKDQTKAALFKLTFTGSS
jgi:hypothetical protein